MNGFFGGFFNYCRTSVASFCDNSQSELSFLCLLNLRGQRIVFSLLFLHFVLNSMDNALFVVLGHFVIECLSPNYLACGSLITWHGTAFDSPLVTFI